MLKRKKKSAALVRFRFISLVASVALIITLIGIALKKNQKQASNSQETVTKTAIKPTDTSKDRLSPSVISKGNSIETSVEKTEATFPTNLSNSLPENFQLVYQPNKSPKLQKSQQLQNIVDEAVALAASEKLPIKPLSITLINVKTGNYAGYQQDKMRYPASVVKLFWMVNFYAQVEKGILSEADFNDNLKDSIQKSDNEAASIILDKISNTQSGQNLVGRSYQNWLQKRLQVNQFFQQAGYENINVSQKTFPIPYLNLYEPKGADLKMRGNPQKPIRNKITTQQASRLLYEIYNQKSISEDSSQKMIDLLTINPHTRAIKKDEKNPNEFNPVRGFLSEPLASEIYFGGKAGWTSKSRQDAAYITTSDGKTAYILVVFAEDRAYAYEWKIFPKISSLILNRMKNLKLNR
ncbi:MAG: serine hydrolase [Cyanobacteria bacterium P01_H01_bin.150]